MNAYSNLHGAFFEESLFNAGVRQISDIQQKQVEEIKNESLENNP